MNARAAISRGDGSFFIDSVEVDAPGPGEVRVRVAAAGLCHTDHQSLRWPGPLVMGHEGAVVIESIGDGVHQPAVGAHVLLNWAIPCGGCPRGVAGQGALCERTQGVDPARGHSDASPDSTRWRGELVTDYALRDPPRTEGLTPLPGTSTRPGGVARNAGTHLKRSLAAGLAVARPPRTFDQISSARRP